MRWSMLASVKNDFTAFEWRLISPAFSDLIKLLFWTEGATAKLKSHIGTQLIITLSD